MRGIISRSVLILIVVLGVQTLSMGQSGSTTSSITGTVTDETGAIIPGVAVKAKNLETNLLREAQSGEDGSFLISQLPPGSYEFTVTAEGFNTKTSRLDLVLGTTTVFNFTMKLGATSEVVEVRGSNLVAEGKTESSTNIDRQRIDGLPINRRNFLDFSLTSARVVMDRVPAQGAAATSGLSFNGQQARFNNIQIDGLENNDLASGSVRSTFSQDAVQEFQIVSDGYSAEFGRAIGGVINIVTKGGTNDYHGNLFGLLRNDTISARDVFAPKKPEYKQYQFGTIFGGPIKRDRAFFFTSFERLSIKQNNIVTIADQTVRSARQLGFDLTNGPVPFALDTTTVLARADWRITPSDSLRVRYNFGGTYNGNFEPFGGLVGGSNAGIQKLDDNSLSVDNTYISAGLNLINETRFLYGRRGQDILPVEAGPLVSLVAPEGTVLFGRSALLAQLRNESIYQIVDIVSLSRGRNQIKFGFDFAYIDVPQDQFNLPFFAGGQAIFTPLNFATLLNQPGLPTLSGLQAFDPTLRTPEQRAFLMSLVDKLPGLPKGLPLADLPLPRTFLQGFGNTLIGTSTKLFSLFLQDEIKLRPNLLLKAGLRYDLNRVRFTPSNNGELSPRISLSYRPGWVPKLSVRASYGLFYGAPLFGPLVAAELLDSGSIKIPVIPFPLSIVPFSLPGHHFPESTTIPAGVNFIPQLSQSSSIQPDLTDPYTQQVSAGFDYFIGDNMAVSLTYDFVRGISLFAVRNINPVVRPVPGNLAASLITGRVDPTRGIVNEFESAFDSYFHGFTALFNRRFTNRLGFLAHYTFSRTIDNFLDFRTAIQETVDPLRPGDERGLSLQDVRHRFVASGTWELSYTQNPLIRNFQLSTILNLNSGRPYNLLAGQDLNMNGDNPVGDRPLGLGRNAGITPGFANIDLRLTRTIAINEQIRLQGLFEIFNLFNRVNISEIDRTFPPDAQGRFNLPAKEGGRFIVPRSRYRNAFSPRQFQVGFKLTF
jgi:hypothetical protein